jgi:hypothetical protein
MGPRIYPSQQDTNTTAKGSLIINFLDIFADQYNDYIQVSVNGLLRDRTYNKVDGLYRTNLNIGDVVLIEIVSDIILFKNITVYRRDYTTDDQEGDMGIVDSLVTFNNNNTTTVSITFTATTVSDGYNFEYRIDGNVGTNPTTDCQIQGLALDNDGAYVLAGTINFDFDNSDSLKLSTSGGTSNSYTNITSKLVYLQGATLNFGGNVINYTTQYGSPQYSLTSGSVFSASTITYNTSVYDWTDMDCNIDGNYQTVGEVSGSLYLSSNSGQTYSAISNSIKYWKKPVIPDNSGFPFYAITSTVGDYLYQINSTTGVTQVTPAKAPTYIYSGGPSLTGTTYFTSLAMSQDTKYIAITYESLSDTVTKDFSYMWSSDSGSTFSFIEVPNCLMKGAKIAMSKDGKYIYIINDLSFLGLNQGRYFYSNNYGSTWTEGTKYNNISITCSATGKYVYRGINSGIGTGPSKLFISSDYGITFTDTSYVFTTVGNYAKPNKN